MSVSGLPRYFTAVRQWFGRINLDRRRHAAYLHIWLGRIIFWGTAVGVGLVAVAFAKAADYAYHSFLHLQTEHAWVPFLIVPAGGAISVWLTRRYFSGAEGSGIPQVIAELSRPEAPYWRPLLSLRIMVGKLIVGVAAIGCGFSLGREGPTVQVGAAIMNMLHRWLPFTLQIKRAHLLVAGGAAGIAAAFNTPLAGIMFAIEELNRGVESRMSGVIITTIVLAGVVAQAFLTSGSYFGHIFVPGDRGDIVKSVMVASLVCGVAGGLFSRMLVMAGTNWPGRLGEWRRAHPVRFALACGVFVAALGYATGGATFGSGYDQTRGLLTEESTVPWFFGPAKFAATVIAYVSGLPGGIFAPSLAIGAGFGHDLAPLIGEGGTPGMLLVLCMAGFLSAVTQAPITSFVIIMEMVDGYSLVIGLMAASLLSSTISRMISPPLYHTLAKEMHARQHAAANPPEVAANDAGAPEEAGEALEPTPPSVAGEVVQKPATTSGQL